MHQTVGANGKIGDRSTALNQPAREDRYRSGLAVDLQGRPVGDRNSTGENSSGCSNVQHAGLNNRSSCMGISSAESLGPRSSLKELGRDNHIADRPGKRTTPVVHPEPNVRIIRTRKPARNCPGTLECIDDDRRLTADKSCSSSDKQRGFVAGPNFVATTSSNESALIHLNSTTAHGKLCCCRIPKKLPRTGFSQDAVAGKLCAISKIDVCSDKIFQNTITAVDYLTRRPDDRIAKHQRARIYCRRTGVGVGPSKGHDAVTGFGDATYVPEEGIHRQVARWIGAAGDIQCRRNARVDVQATAPGDKVTRTTGRGVGVAHPVDDAHAGAGVECVAAARAKCDRAGRTALGAQIESCAAEGQRSPIVDREPTAGITLNVTRTRTQNQSTGIHRRHPTVSVGAIENGGSRSILG